jgi:hypothetical protein
MWGGCYKLRTLDYNGFSLLKWGDGDKTLYSFPAGEGDLRAAVTALIKDSCCEGIPFVLTGITDDTKAELDDIFPGVFEYTPSRDRSDYVYLRERLSTLSGKKLQSKRNHITRFKDNKDWLYEPFTKENIDECYEMSREWCEKYGCNNELKIEFCAVTRAFENFFALGLDGGLLRLNGKVVAYSIGEPLDSQTYVIHVEKAYREIQGAYAMINQQFVLRNCQNHVYINREEDMGEEGLRRAKTSYGPDILLTKYSAVVKEMSLSDFTCGFKNDCRVESDLERMLW